MDRLEIALLAAELADPANNPVEILAPLSESEVTYVLTNVTLQHLFSNADVVDLLWSKSVNTADTGNLTTLAREWYTSSQATNSWLSRHAKEYALFSNEHKVLFYVFAGQAAAPDNRELIISHLAQIVENWGAGKTELANSSRLIQTLASDSERSDLFMKVLTILSTSRKKEVKPALLQALAIKAQIVNIENVDSLWGPIILALLPNVEEKEKAAYLLDVLRHKSQPSDFLETTLDLTTRSHFVHLYSKFLDLVIEKHQSLRWDAYETFSNIHKQVNCCTDETGRCRVNTGDLREIDWNDLQPLDIIKAVASQPQNRDRVHIFQSAWDILGHDDKTVFALQALNKPYLLNDAIVAHLFQFEKEKLTQHIQNEQPTWVYHYPSTLILAATDKNTGAIDLSQITTFMSSLRTKDTVDEVAILCAQNYDKLFAGKETVNNRLCRILSMGRAWDKVIDIVPAAVFLEAFTSKVKSSSQEMVSELVVEHMGAVTQVLSNLSAGEKQAAIKTLDILQEKAPLSSLAKLLQATLTD